MIINHNLSSIYAHRQLKINTFETDKVMETLSSGLRINRARDDAAGLAVSEKMRSQINGLHMASKNAQDGISFVQAAEGWLQETNNVVQRIRELSVQAANGIYTTADRMQIQVEVSQLVDEVNRIASHAEFNTLKPLRGAFAESDGTESAMEADPIYYNEGDNPGGIFIHVGANMDQREKLYIENMNAHALGIASSATDTGASKMAISVSSVENANLTIGTLDMALAKISSQRANMGAYQNRLEHAIRGIDIAAENLQSAESAIRDTDMAKAMIDFVKNQILSNASTSMLAQSNVRPQMVLQLLG